MTQEYKEHYVIARALWEFVQRQQAMPDNPPETEQDEMQDERSVMLERAAILILQRDCAKLCKIFAETE